MNASAIKTALAATATGADLDHAAKAYGRWGAHRAYVLISGTIDGDARDYSRKSVNTALKALTAAGAKIMPCHGCNGKGIYLGYDNFEGGKYAARGMAIARGLEEAGIIARVDAAGD